MVIMGYRSRFCSQWNLDHYNETDTDAIDGIAQ